MHNSLICTPHDFYTYVDYHDNSTEPTAAQPAASEDTTTPAYAYYIIGIGSGVLLIVLTIVALCFAYTCYVKYNNAIELPPTEDPWKHLYSVSIAIQLKYVCTAFFSCKHYYLVNGLLYKLYELQ